MEPGYLPDTFRVADNSPEIFAALTIGTDPRLKASAYN
jgi:hypothetical protein